MFYWFNECVKNDWICRKYDNAGFITTNVALSALKACNKEDKGWSFYVVFILYHVNTIKTTNR